MYGCDAISDHVSFVGRECGSLAAACSIGRCAGADRGLERCFGIGAAGAWAQARHIDAGGPVVLDPRATLLRRSCDTGAIDHGIAHRAIGLRTVVAPLRLSDPRSLWPQNTP